MVLREKLDSMDNEELLAVAKALNNFPYFPGHSWDDPGPYGCPTMDNWAQAVFSEADNRGLITNEN